MKVPLHGVFLCLDGTATVVPPAVVPGRAAGLPPLWKCVTLLQFAAPTRLFIHYDRLRDGRAKLPICKTYKKETNLK
jgi:hypothetical protein